ncbi:XPG domain containing-domain-containing protein [Rostrohypoxylon terebratum]|nr:XPG domain containing-domain-containing protein [Rostrohypoxylon terebratum]
MGLYGFASGLERLGTYSSLSGDSVVIDGPGLAHRISEYCMRRRPPLCGFATFPSYSIIGSTVIDWLNRLKTRNVNVRKIYFDGYLPSSKWEVRKNRLARQTTILAELASTNLLGSAIAPANAFSHIKDYVNDFDDILTTPNKMPSPPFLVPAVLEALKNDKDWKHLVFVVPGEADTFCAEDIRRNGGTLLTADSDLVVQDLGPEGSVAFFWSMTTGPPFANKIMAQKMSFHHMNQRLRLTQLGGLTRVAFESMKGDRWGDPLEFDVALRKTKDAREDTLQSPEYKKFIEELEPKRYLPNNHPVLGLLSSLDPRISEFIIQALLLIDEASWLEDKSLRGPETLSIFLPILMDNYARKSAWTDSLETRQLAYHILQTSTRQKISRIVEYRTLRSKLQTGREIQIRFPNPAVLNADCKRLIALLEKLAKNFSPTPMQWLAFAVYWDVKRSSSEGDEALSAQLVEEANQYQSDPQTYSWDLMHFTAQLQAHLYSLRIVKQILDVVLVIGQNVPAAAQQLHDHLASLPPIAEWPTVESMMGLLSEFGKMDGLDMIADILEVPRENMKKIPKTNQTLQENERVFKRDKFMIRYSTNKYYVLNETE